MNVVCFDYRAKFGHFLRAEANANGVTYPVPPRTVLLGLLGAILGLDKDAPQAVLGQADVAVGGPVPRRFWHKTNVRKVPPAPLPLVVKRSMKPKESAREKNFRFPQEWLWRPAYRVWAALPQPYHTDLVDRLQQRRWHFTPSMGLSEMLAEVEFVRHVWAERLSGR